MTNRKRISAGQLRTALPKLIRDAAKHNADVLAKSIREWPSRFVRASKQFYPSVLNRPTGRLWRSFARLVRKISESKILLGERSNVKYAKPLHDGFHGRVTVPSHLVRRHSVRTHTTRSGRRVPAHSRGPFTRRTHTRMLNIQARYFFKIPMLREAHAAVNELAGAIGWPSG